MIHLYPKPHSCSKRQNSIFLSLCLCTTIHSRCGNKFIKNGTKLHSNMSARIHITVHCAMSDELYEIITIWIYK